MSVGIFTFGKYSILFICRTKIHNIYFISSLSTYTLARKIQKLHDDESRITKTREFSSKEAKKAFKKRFTKRRKRILLLDFAINLGILCVIKYADFILSGVSSVLGKFGLDWSKEFNFVLPLGISFYTFMVVGYILDIYWKRYRAETNYLKLALFTMYFPHIVQGPIGRYNKLAPQFLEDHPFDYDRVTKGFQLILWGYFEKWLFLTDCRLLLMVLLQNGTRLQVSHLFLQYHCSQFRCIWIGWDVWILLMAYRKYLALIWTRTSGIRSSQRICRNSGEDGIFHLVHGLRIIYYILYQCQHCVRRLINSQERNGAIRFHVHFQL